MILPLQCAKTVSGFIGIVHKKWKYIDSLDGYWVSLIPYIILFADKHIICKKEKQSSVQAKTKSLLLSLTYDIVFVQTHKVQERRIERGVRQDGKIGLYAIFTICVNDLCAIVIGAKLILKRSNRASILLHGLNFCCCCCCCSCHV